MGNSIPRTIYDDLGRKLNYFFPLKRIISLVPSITELLFDIGLENEIVGVTKKVFGVFLQLHRFILDLTL